MGLQYKARSTGLDRMTVINHVAALVEKVAARKIPVDIKQSEMTIVIEVCAVRMDGCVRPAISMTRDVAD